MSASLTPMPYDTLPGWTSDDPTPVIDALADCDGHAETVKPYRTGSLGVTTADFAEAFAAARNGNEWTAETARGFFE